MTDQAQTEAVLEAHYNTPPESITLYSNEFKRVGTLFNIAAQEDETKTEFVFQQYQWWDIKLDFSYSRDDMAPFWMASMKGSQAEYFGDALMKSPDEALDSLMRKVVADYHDAVYAHKFAEEKLLHTKCDITALHRFIEDGKQPKP